MTAPPPPIKSTRFRPAKELFGQTADGSTTAEGSGSGLCVIGATWGNGTDHASVVAGEYDDLPPVPFELDAERWQLFAYDSSGAPLAIDAVVDVLATDYATNSFASIAGTELPTLASEPKHNSTTLAGWRLVNPPDTMYRFKLVSFTDGSGTVAKIVLGVKAFAPG